MHFLTYVFIERRADVHAAVAEALAPFSADRKTAPRKGHLGNDEVEAMARHFGVSRIDLSRLADCMPAWNACAGGVDGRGLFAWRTSNPDARWDWYAIGGRWADLAPGNQTRARSLLRPRAARRPVPHDFVTPDGRWHSCERAEAGEWPSVRFVRKPPGRWHAEFERALRAFPDALVVVVDCHL